MIDWYFGAPRSALGLICLACVLMLAFGLYLQHVVGLEPARVSIPPMRPRRLFKSPIRSPA